MNSSASINEKQPASSSSSSSSMLPLDATSTQWRSRTVGILGGGQLGRMLATAARLLDVKVVILDPLPESPAGQVAVGQTIGSFDDEPSILDFVRSNRLDVLTAEIEHVECNALARIEREHLCNVQPSAATIALIQDKFLQKEHLRDHELPLGLFAIVQNRLDLDNAVKRFKLPLMLKSRRYAYDGRGNFVLRDLQHVEEALKELGQSSSAQQPWTLYAEKFVPFTQELAVMVARALDGTCVAYPCVSTTQVNNICHQVFAPASLSPELQQKATEFACAAVRSLPLGAGVYGVEMFHVAASSSSSSSSSSSDADQILINEIAPRPHNSGHYTIEACATSQFSQHLRAVLGLPLGSTRLTVGAAIMTNVLGTGDKEIDVELSWLPCQAALSLPDLALTVHWYGKKGVRLNRKLGHVTLTAKSMREALAHQAVYEQRIAQMKALLLGQQTIAPTASLSSSTTSSSSSDAVVPASNPLMPLPLVGVIMGSDSDIPYMNAAREVLKSFDIPYEFTIISAHRTPDLMLSYTRSAHARGLRCIIAGAGGAAHLPGMVASLTPLPVIGVPIALAHLDGVDSLHSIVQMPSGVPCATVAINNSTNAALLAVRILSVADESLVDKMKRYQDKLKETVENKAKNLNLMGVEAYLDSMPKKK